MSVVVIANFVSQNCYWPLPQDMANAILDGGQKLQAYGMLYSMAGVAMFRKFYCPPGIPMHRVVRDLIETMRPRFGDPEYKTRVDRKKRERMIVTPPVRPVSRPRPRGRGRRPQRDSVTTTVGTRDLLGAASEDVVMHSPPTVVVEPITSEQMATFRSGPPSPLSYDKDLLNDLVQVQIHELAVASGMPPLEYDSEESPMPSIAEEETSKPIKEEEVMTPEDEFQDMPPLEGDASDEMASVAVSPLQSDSADVPVLPCPETPEEIEITTEAPEGPPSPCAVLPAEQGVSFPVFPRGRDYRDRRSTRLLPLILQIYQRLDHLCEAVDFHQRMLNYSRRDLLALGEVVKEIIEISGLGLGDRDLRRQCDGDQ